MQLPTSPISTSSLVLPARTLGVRAALLTSAVWVALACTPPAPAPTDAGTQTDAGQLPDGGPDTDPGTPGDAGQPTDPGNAGTLTITTCDNPPTTARNDGQCDVVAGTRGTLLVGDVLVPGEVFEQGSVLVDENGIIQCVGCDCAAQAADATQVICPDAVISPGLINAHDHIGWMGSDPWVAADNNVDAELRWEHRHDWRKGKRGNPKISTPGGASDDDKSWGELRFALGGATSIFGSGDSPGLLRNLDGFSGTVPGINQPVARYETFPLGDSDGTQLSEDCNYPEIDGPQSMDAYVPHVAEGIDIEARNEFRCLTGQGQGAQDTLQGNTAIIHGVGLLPQDVSLLASRGAKLVWSPRSNISLYGDTAAVTLFDRLGVSIGLGTDWMPSGSMNMLRELKCADDLNQRNFGGYFSDEALWLMATLGSARALAMDDALGVLATGRSADIAIFRNDGQRYHRAILDANPGDVVLVMRGGEVLSGDTELVAALDSDCDVLADVCGFDKRVCLNREIGKSLSNLNASVGNNYPLFFCDEPVDEPSCLPARTLGGDVINGSNTYDGMSLADDNDGDGILNGDDSCADIFNPKRPLDEGVQSDVDADGVGDVCDPCPLNPNTTDCQTFDPNDGDGDGTANLQDNCPDLANEDQADADQDGRGDVCDPCPNAYNPGDAGCPATIYQIKTDADLEGQRVSVPELVVTSVIYNGFFGQMNPSDSAYDGAENSGIFIYTGTGALPSRWDLVQVTGATVADFYGQTQLNAATWTATGTVAAISPYTLSTADVAQAVSDGAASAFEGLFVELTDVEVTDVAPVPGAGDSGENEFEVSGGIRVDDVNYRIEPAPVVGEKFASLQGPLAWRNEHLKLLPRDENDVVSGIAEVQSVGPSPAFVRVGSTGALGDGLSVFVARNVSEDLVVDITIDDSTLATVAGGSVTIPAGARSASIPVRGEAPGTVTVRAARRGSSISQSAELRVIAVDQPATLSSIEPTSLVVAAGDMASVVVRLDVPAPAAGVNCTVTLSDGLGSAPATLDFAADDQSVTLDFTAGASAASGTLSVSDGTNTVSTNIEVVEYTGALVINEVNYDNPDADTAEYVEIYNGGAVDVNLTGYALHLVNGSNNSVYLDIDLGGAGTLAAGQFLLVAPDGLSSPAEALRVTLPEISNGAIQNGAPDGIVLVSATEVIDAIAYEGSLPAVGLGSPYGSVDLGDGSALTDSNGTVGSIARKIDGVDTDVHADDWAFTTLLTPGAPNAFP